MGLVVAAFEVERIELQSEIETGALVECGFH